MYTNTEGDRAGLSLADLLFVDVSLNKTQDTYQSTKVDDNSLGGC